MALSVILKSYFVRLDSELQHTFSQSVVKKMVPCMHLGVSILSYLTIAAFQFQAAQRYSA